MNTPRRYLQTDTKVTEYKFKCKQIKAILWLVINLYEIDGQHEICLPGVVGTPDECFLFLGALLMRRLLSDNIYKLCSELYFSPKIFRFYHLANTVIDTKHACNKLQQANHKHIFFSSYRFTNYVITSVIDI